MSIDSLSDILSASRFARSKVVFRTSLDGAPYAQVEWSWKNDERAALVEFLRSAGYRAQDRVAYVIVVEE